MNRYVIMTDYLHDGKYLCNRTRWHEKLRVLFAKWLLLSIEHNEPLEIKTETGTTFKPSDDCIVNIEQTIVLKEEK